jgi:YggT family protein
LGALGIIGLTVFFILTVYYWLVIIRVLLSWFTVSDYNPVVKFLRRVTDPVLNFTRRLFPLTLGGIDFSPILAIALIYFFSTFINETCRNIDGGATPGIVFPIFLICLLLIVRSLTWLLMLLMIARIILSMVSPSFSNPLVLIVYGATEPLLAPLRGILPKRGPYGLDLKAVLFFAFLLLFYVFLLNNLLQLSEGWATSYRYHAARIM